MEVPEGTLAPPPPNVMLAFNAGVLQDWRINPRAPL